MRGGVKALGLVVALAMPSLAAAQDSPLPIRYGKWVLLAGAVGLNIAAADAHRDAERVFDEIEERCAIDQALCDLTDDGGYADLQTEQLYQQTLRLDRRSRTFLFGGEAALLGAAALFIWEFARPKSPPGNIPFEPEVSVRAGTTRIGLRAAW
jgi:hypothetical protein